MITDNAVKAISVDITIDKPLLDAISFARALEKRRAIGNDRIKPKLLAADLEKPATAQDTAPISIIPIAMKSNNPNVREPIESVQLN